MNVWIIGIIFLVLSKCLADTSGSDDDDDDCDECDDDFDECDDDDDDDNECDPSRFDERNCKMQRRVRCPNCKTKVFTHCSSPCYSSDLSVSCCTTKRGVSMRNFYYCPSHTTESSQLNPTSTTPQTSLKRLPSDLIIGFSSHGGPSRRIQESMTTMRTSSLVITPSSINTKLPDPSTPSLQTMETRPLTFEPSSKKSTPITPYFIKTKLPRTDPSTPSLQTIETSPLTFESSSIKLTRTEFPISKIISMSTNPLILKSSSIKLVQAKVSTSNLKTVKTTPLIVTSSSITLLPTESSISKFKTIETSSLSLKQSSMNTKLVRVDLLSASSMKTIETSSLSLEQSSMNTKLVRVDLLSTSSMKTIETSSLSLKQSSMNTKLVRVDLLSASSMKTIETSSLSLKQSSMNTKLVRVDLLSTSSMKTIETSSLSLEQSSMNTKLVRVDLLSTSSMKTMETSSLILPSFSMKFSPVDESTLSLIRVKTSSKIVTPSSIYVEKSSKIVKPSSMYTEFPPSDVSTLSYKTMETRYRSVPPTEVSTSHELETSSVISEMKSDVLFSSTSIFSISGSHHYFASSSALDPKWPRSSSVYPSSPIISRIMNTTSVPESEIRARTSTLTRTASDVTSTAVTTKLSLSTLQVTSASISPTKSTGVFSSTVGLSTVSCEASETGRQENKGLLRWNKTKVNETYEQQCRFGPLGKNAVRKCEMDDFGIARWSDVNDTMCAARPSCLAGKSGDSFRKGIMNWPKTPVNMKATVHCPYNIEDNNAYRWCTMNTTLLTPFWNTIHSTNCNMLETKNTTLDNLGDMVIKEDNERQVAALLNYVTSHMNISEKAVKTAANMLKRMVEEAKDLFQISTDLLGLVSNIMGSNSIILAAAHKQNKSTEKILTYIGRMMTNMSLNGEKTCCSPTSNVIAEAWDLKKSAHKRTFNPDGSAVLITLPDSLLKRYKSGKRVYFFNFKNDNLFPQLNKNSVKKINSEIVSATIEGNAVNNLSDPVVIKFILKDKNVSANHSCVFWDFEADGGYGGWKKNGCELEMMEDGRAKCSCNHLTHFGILVDLFPGTTSESRLYLEQISFIGCYLSIVGLVLTMITLLSFKKYRVAISGKILFNLCVALLFLLVIFVAGIERAEEETSCVAIAALLHYFVLVVFLWMGIEAFHLFLNIVLDRLHQEYGATFIMKCAAIAWLVPLFIVLTSVLVSQDDYKDNNFCRVNGNTFYIAFLVPVLTILLFNFIIFVLVCKSLLSDTIRVTTRSRGRLQFRRIIGIMSVLGITWLFGILAVGDLRIVFQYLFCISTSLQGFSIFVICCMTDRSVRERLVRLLCLLPDSDRNRAIMGSSSTQYPTDIVIELEQFEPAYDRDPVHPGPHPWRMITLENGSRAWVIPEEPARPRINVPLSDEPVNQPGVQPRVNVPLSIEPAVCPGINVPSSDEQVRRPKVNVPLSIEAAVHPRVSVSRSEKPAVHPRVNFSEKPVVYPRGNVASPDEQIGHPRLNAPLSDEPAIELRVNEPSSDKQVIRPRVNEPSSDKQAMRPRVNVPLSDEPIPGVDKLVQATFSQSGLKLQQSSGEVSLRSPDGSIIFIDNGRIVDVPHFTPGMNVGESLSRSAKKKRRPSKSKVETGAERSKDLRRWSELGWSPRFKNYSQNLPDVLKPDDGLDELNLKQFQDSEPKDFATAQAKRQDAHAPVRMMVGDDVEHGYFEKYRNDEGNIDGSLSNSQASASGAIPSTSIDPRYPSEPLNNENVQRNSDSTTDSSDSSGNMSLKWSEANFLWLPGPRSTSRSTNAAVISDEEIGQDNMSHFQEL